MKVLIVDDHPLILAALKAMIEGLTPGVEVVAVASASAAREVILTGAAPDLLLLDLELGATDGFELLREMRLTNPAVSVVVLSGSDRSADVIRSIDLGAMGFLPKRMSTEALAEALRLIMDGGIFVPSMSVDGSATWSPSVRSDVIRPNHAAARASPSAEELGLTPRQSEVLTLLLQGKPNKDIARRMGLSVETIKDHVQAVLRALGVNSRTQAVLAVGELTQRRMPGVKASGAS